MLKDDYRDLKDHIAGEFIPATANPWTPDYDLVNDDLNTRVENLVSADGVKAVIANAHTGETKMIQGIFEYDTLLPPQEQIDPEEREELREILSELGEL